MQRYGDYKISVFGKDSFPLNYMLPINFIFSSKIKTGGARSEIHRGIINFNLHVLKCKNTALN